MTRTAVGAARWSAFGAVLLSAAALLGAAPAAADPTDDAFLAALAKNGITISNPDTALSMARKVCTGLDNGQPSTALAMRIVKDTDLSPRQAGYFVGVSVAAYCPQYKGNTDDSLNWLVPFPPMM
ncbi:hypothetical protein BST11_22650 [Mycobacterium alsense]|uniref:DUF732 domain-containing protein n=1 Tax=Mycobacterium alsense TaxID=324058 RepID=A0AA41XWB3_9MYCO|nr:DUF732 domain-containing protein [Mycobacterium alsense]MCV7381664.1 DUF732 domain-containing protein [Mycobacterium alsense]OQZ88476.1 hypothetical protein BST11_22650 [Mycobacterium alsense]